MTENERRGPLSREEAMRWGQQQWDKNPTEKEKEIRQALAATLNLQDTLREEGIE